MTAISSFFEKTHCEISSIREEVIKRGKLIGTRENVKMLHKLREIILPESHLTLMNLSPSSENHTLLQKAAVKFYVEKYI